MITYHYKNYNNNTSVTDLLTKETVNSRQVVGRLYPSGKISIGVSPPEKMLKADNEYECTRGIYSWHERRHWDVYEGLVKEVRCVEEQSSSSLGLSAVPNYHREKIRHGLKGITSGGRNKVKESAYLLE